MRKLYKTKTSKYNISKKLFGSYLDRTTTDHISLYCLFKDISRTCIHQNLINNFIKKIPNIDTLIDGIAKKVIKDWDATHVKNINKPGWSGMEQISLRWEDYKKELRNDLKVKKLPDNIIDIIFQKVEEGLCKEAQKS